MALAIGLVAWATLAPQLGPRIRPTVWCIACDPGWLSDGIANVWLFVPLGAALVHSGRRPWRVVLVCVLGSAVIEILQRVGVTTGRTPALSDVLANSAGAAIGAFTMARRGALAREMLHASFHRSRALLLGWTVATTAMLLASGWAVAPAVRAPRAPRPRAPRIAPAAQDSVKSSLMATIPGREFIQSTLQGTVNGVRIPVKTTGQVIASLPPLDTVRVTLLRRVIDEKDRRDRLIILAYLHGPQTAAEQLLIGQFGDDVLLRSAVNGSRIGLQTPSLRLRGVFALDSALIWQTSRIDALVVPGRLSLSVAVPDARIGTVAGDLALSPALGWTLLQPIIGATARIAPAMTLLWLALWFLPGGFWLGRMIGEHATARRVSPLVRAAAAYAWSAVPLAAAQLNANWLGISPLALWQLAGGVAGAIAGVLLAARVTRRPRVVRQPLATPLR